MAKFRVGDEVKLGGGCARVIHIESTGDFPYLVERADNRIEFCNDAEMMLIAPAIPDGWTPADEPPSDPEHLYFSEYITINARDEVVSGAHDLKTITELSFVDAHNEGEYVGVYRKVGDTSPSGIMGQVEPERKADPRVRYAVTREGKPDGYDFDKENCYRTYDDAVTSAKKNFYAWDKQHVEVWKLVAIVNPPAEPEVVKLEE